MSQEYTHEQMKRKVRALEDENTRLRRLENELRERQDALRKSAERYRTILETIEDGYFEVDTAGNFTFFNDSMCSILGYSREELMGMNNRSYMDAENARIVFQAFNWVYRTGKPYKALDWQLIRKDGAKIWVEASFSLIKDGGGRPVGFKGIARDVTERKKAQQEKEMLHAQLRQAQKMEAIGTLAGGIAHDFNNILSAVIGYTELCLDEAPEDSTQRTNLSRVLSAGSRAKDLVRQILTLSRRGESEPAPTPIVPLVKEVLKMLRSTLPASIELQEQILCDDQVIVSADPTQIHQVLVNLATNAKHAMYDGSGVLEVCIQEAGSAEVPGKCDSMPGADRYVQITVRDTGVGIPEKYLDKIFEPYFTTKKKGVGTGLGLSIVHGIIKDHQGHVTVESKPGQGACFHIYLPLTDISGRAGRAPDSARAGEAGPRMSGGTEHILFVDDEQMIVDMQKKSLENLGYHVTATTSSVAALEAFRADPDRFDLVIMDMTMPTMTGDLLAHHIKEIRPGVPLILCTGFSERAALDKSELGVDDLLIKPIDRWKLAKTIRNLLDAARIQ